MKEEVSAQSPFTRKVVKLISAIPQGRVCTYGIIATHAGNGAGARQVARLLHSCSRKYQLPWHRVVNRQGQISLSGEACRRQRRLLLREGVLFSEDGRIDFSRYLWWPGAEEGGIVGPLRNS